MISDRVDYDRIISFAYQGIRICGTSSKYQWHFILMVTMYREILHYDT